MLQCNERLMAFLEVQEVGREESGQWLLRGVSLSLQRGDRLAIAGATGSGKTSLMKIIGGLLPAAEGKVEFEGKVLMDPREQLIPGHKRIAYLSQHFELRNHYRVIDFLELNNQYEGSDATTLYELCDIAHLLQRWTHQLSGGERQRVALAARLLGNPSLLLLDEPFSNLDLVHKNHLKAVLDRVASVLDITTILVSHDPADLLPWAGEILVLQEGRAVQKDHPQKIYFEPTGEYVASLFGSYMKVGEHWPALFGPGASIGLRPGKILRPSQLILTEKGRGLKAGVVSSRFAGTHFETELSSAAGRLLLHHSQPLPADSVVYLAIVAH